MAIFRQFLAILGIKWRYCLATFNHILAIFDILKHFGGIFLLFGIFRQFLAIFENVHLVTLPAPFGPSDHDLLFHGGCLRHP